ncbi:uncharacterized protein SPPG_03580 [Spizellomyces punctatus DAOM BR117]|uniref:Dynein regulatory complex protein 9 n=1 Tax=Spizellomyces punctatus (strain DAOM BR117) TaxID=645134 RepID=A0A0L0HL57_SPIPD|nr:uncharacterized protein SPPG_03580 [Spizellomyces punctatus DAOM BR117]KND01788.1 hypothetical protein SPPG_03580 [Spizellomyces punctatus DAOM BR117]|eukprot:XP_016609827.1 hypothetical protein SPPG_03580 [Spizellomyces punctatus DAOM BR117]
MLSSPALPSSLPPLPTRVPVGDAGPRVVTPDNATSQNDEEFLELLTGAASGGAIPLPPGKAQSYIAIFEDALEQLAVLGDIGGGGDGAVTGKAETRPLGDQITRILKDQRALEARYEQLLVEQDKLKKLPNKTKFKESQIAILDVTNELKQSSQVLATNLKSHPNVAKNLLKIQQERSALQTLIGRTIRELREHRFDSLMSTVEEEYKKRNTLQDTIDRERDASQLLRSLHKELSNEKKLLEDETNDRNQVIQQLKDTIQEINILTNSEQKYIKKETKAHENSVRQRCQHEETRLMEDKSVLSKRLEQEQRAHEKIVDFLTRQRETLERQIQDWMTKYEEDTEAKSTEIETLKQKRSQDLDKFEELLAAYEELEKIVEEDRANKQREAERLKIEKQRDMAARMVQRWWRRRLEAKKQSAKTVKSAKGKKGAKGKGGKATAPGTAQSKTRGKTPTKK